MLCARMRAAIRNNKLLAHQWLWVMFLREQTLCLSTNISQLSCRGPETSTVKAGDGTKNSNSKGWWTLVVPQNAALMEDFMCLGIIDTVIYTILRMAALLSISLSLFVCLFTM